MADQIISKAQQKIIDELKAAQQVNGDGEEISQEQLDMIKKLTIDPHKLDPPEYTDDNNQLGRFALQGLTFGFADELEAYATSLYKKDVDYLTIRNEIRAKMADYAKENGGKALAAEMAGAVLPTLLSVFGGPAAWSASLSNIVRFGKAIFTGTRVTSTGKSIFTAGQAGKSVFEQAHRSGLATAGYSLGVSEKEAFGEDADKLGLVTDVGTGYGFGYGIGGAFSATGKFASPFITKQLEKLRSKKNDKLSLAVRQELDRMVKKTGYSAEEKIQKVADGEIIIENESLRYWIKSLVAQAETGKSALVLKETLQGKPPVYDKAGELIEERIVGRPKQTRDELQTTMQESIKRGTSKKDLLKAYQQTDDEFRAIETAAYNKILKKNNTELDDATLDVLLQSIRRFEGGAETINKMIAGDELVKKAFYKIDDETGEMILTRMPTLADAELIYRSSRNQKDKLFRRGEFDLSGVLSNNMHKLLTQLNKFSPALKRTRANAHTLRTSREAFLMG